MLDTAYVLHLGDCLDVLPTLAPVASIVTDPPAGISFMGAEWDGDKGGRDAWVAWLAERLRAAAALLPPGGAALVWALPRTSHWTAYAIEEAGLRIDDRLAHIFGSGFPKHKSKLKPAVEDWWLARKPGGAGWLNVDGCRVSFDSGDARRVSSPLAYGSGRNLGYRGDGRADSGSIPPGRYPPHLLLSHGADCAPGACVEGCPAAVLGAQSGERPGAASNSAPATAVGFTRGARGGAGVGEPWAQRNAARFFPQFWPDGDEPPFCYAAKASRAERNKGCEGMPLVTSREWRTGNAPPNISHRVPDKQAQNHHPTVKNQALMRWLVRLVTPPGGVVLDPFAGSGSTGVAALAEGFGFVGVEASAEYLEIARARLAHAAGPLFAGEAA